MSAWGRAVSRNKIKWVKHMETLTIIVEIVVATIGVIVGVAWVVLPFTIINHMKELEELMRAQGTMQRMMAEEMKVHSELMAGGQSKVSVATGFGSEGPVI